MAPRRIIIDTDPGKDDAVAILLALASPELEVLSLLPVGGNVPLALTERNARRLLALAGRSDIPVHPGCQRPLLRSPVHAAHVHGPSGLGVLRLPDPVVPAREEHGVAHLIGALRAAEAGTVTLCLLGPATNLAVALVQAPELAERIAEVVMMAGASGAGGNVTPAAEFNAYADPGAARIVLESGAKVTLVPLDLTHQVRLDTTRIERLRGVGTAAARAVVRLFETDGPEAGGGPPMHDPCVITHLIRPGLFRGALVHVGIETAGEQTRGMTVVDRRGTTGQTPNATFLTAGDADGFFDLLEERLATLP